MALSSSISPPETIRSAWRWHERSSSRSADPRREKAHSSGTRRERRICSSMSSEVRRTESPSSDKRRRVRSRNDSESVNSTSTSPSRSSSRPVSSCRVMVDSSAPSAPCTARRSCRVLSRSRSTLFISCTRRSRRVRRMTRSPTLSSSASRRSTSTRRKPSVPTRRSDTARRSPEPRRRSTGPRWMMGTPSIGVLTRGGGTARCALESKARISATPSSIRSRIPKVGASCPRRISVHSSSSSCAARDTASNPTEPAEPLSVCRWRKSTSTTSGEISSVLSEACESSFCASMICARYLSASSRKRPRSMSVSPVAHSWAGVLPVLSLLSRLSAIAAALVSRRPPRSCRERRADCAPPARAASAPRTPAAPAVRAGGRDRPAARAGCG